MEKQRYDNGFGDIYELFESYFGLLKAVRDLENEIPDLDSKEEKIKAFKEYFKELKKLKELKVNVEDYLKVLNQI